MAAGKAVPRAANAFAGAGGGAILFAPLDAAAHNAAAAAADGFAGFAGVSGSQYCVENGSIPH